MSRLPYVSIQPGAAAVMLTDTVTADAPVFVINRDPAGGRIYLGTDPSVAPSNGGVPLEPGTSLTWTTPGQLWAVADAGNTAAVALTITDHIDDWQPSPAAVAAEVAAQLLATGVPNVLTSKTIFNGTLGPGQSQLLEIGGFASIALCNVYTTAVGGTTGINTAATIQQLSSFDANEAVVMSDTLNGLNVNPVRMAVIGAYLTVANNSAGNMHVELIGSNRPALRRWDTRYNDTGGDFWQLGATAMTNLTAYPLSQSQPGTQLQGGCWGSFSVSGTTVQGRMEMVIPALNNLTLTVCETSEMFTTTQGTARVKDKLIALPAQPYTFQFRCAGTTGTAAATVVLLEQSP